MSLRAGKKIKLYSQKEAPIVQEAANRLVTLGKRQKDTRGVEIKNKHIKVEHSYDKISDTEGACGDNLQKNLFPMQEMPDDDSDNDVTDDANELIFFQ